MFLNERVELSMLTDTVSFFCRVCILYLKLIYLERSFEGTLFELFKIEVEVIDSLSDCRDQ